MTDANDEANGSQVRRAGSCLCGAIAFDVEGSIMGVGSCHCSKCRKVSGTGGNMQFIVSVARFRWLRGADRIVKFARTDGWGTSRCDACGSPVPASYDGGKCMWVQAGLMDDPLETSILWHIFCGSRADWDHESPQVRHFDEYPQW